MSLFGFGKKKEYQRGMADAACSAGAKLSEVDEAISRLGENLRTGVSQSTENIRSILDVLESNEREKLFGLSDRITIREDLEDNQKVLLMSVLYSLAAKLGTVNEAQQHYLRSMYQYLGLRNDSQIIDLAKISNVDSKDDSTILYMVLNEFLYLGFQDWKYLESEDFQVVSKSFNLSQSVKEQVIHDIRWKVQIMGIEAIVLPYESKDFPRDKNTKYADSDKVIPDDYIWPNRDQRIETIVTGLDKALGDGTRYGWKILARDDVNLNDFLTDDVKITDDVAVLLSDFNAGLVMQKSGITVFNETQNFVFLPFDGVKEIYSVVEDKEAILLKMFDNTLQEITIPSIEDKGKRESFKGMNLPAFYNLVLTFVQRGPFYVGDVDADLLAEINKSFGNAWDAANTDLISALRISFNSFHTDYKGFNIVSQQINHIDSMEWLIFDDYSLRATGIEIEGSAKKLDLDDIEQVKVVLRERTIQDDKIHIRQKVAKGVFNFLMPRIGDEMPGVRKYDYEYHAILKSGGDKVIFTLQRSVELPGLLAKAIQKAIELVKTTEFSN